MQVLVEPVGLEPTSPPHLEASPDYKPGALTIKLRFLFLAPLAGFEPA